MPRSLLLGLDIGGTTSRALLTDIDGRRLGYGSAPGGNPVAYQPAEAFTAVERAITAALSGHDPTLVEAAVIGMAGVGRLDEPAVRGAFDTMWHRIGLRCAYRAVGDTVVAFAAGTTAPHGTLLLAGTGAVASQIRDRELVRTSDGHGWLLGDLGSGFWIGREAVRATLAHLDGWADSTELVRRLLTELIGTPRPPRRRETVNATVNAVRRDQPVALARFAPLVCDTAAEDPVAAEILRHAAAHLIESAARVRGDEDGPLVLAGGLLSAATPLATEVRAAAGQRWPGITFGTATDGAAGAAWLAALRLPAASGSAETLHAALLTPG